MRDLLGQPRPYVAVTLLMLSPNVEFDDALQKASYIHPSNVRVKESKPIAVASTTCIVKSSQSLSRSHLMYRAERTFYRESTR
jgi:hypothetical protein